MKFILLLSFICAVFFGNAQDWKSTYKEAVLEAKTENKPLILVFSGSDWCGPCKRLNKNIWASEEFKTYAADHYVLYNADFPKKKGNQLSLDKVAENNALAAEHNPKNQYPLVIVLDKNENILGKTGYKKMKPRDYISNLNTFLE